MLHHATWRILVPRLGIEPGAMVVKGLSLNHWTAREFPVYFLIIAILVGIGISLWFWFAFPSWEKEMATHSRVLAWRIPGTAEPDGLPSMGSHRVRHDWSDLAAAAAAWLIMLSVFLVPISQLCIFSGLCKSFANFFGGRIYILLAYCCCSAAQSWSTLCDSVVCSMPGLPVLHYFPEFAHSCPLSWWCHLTILASVIPFSFCLESFLAWRFFPSSQLFASGGQNIGPSASASVLPVNIQSWFPLGLTGLISLQSKGLSRVFSSITVWRHNSSAFSLLCGPSLTSVHNYWKNHSFD